MRLQKFLQNNERVSLPSSKWFGKDTLWYGKVDIFSQSNCRQKPGFYRAECFSIYKLINTEKQTLDRYFFDLCKQITVVIIYEGLAIQAVLLTSSRLGSEKKMNLRLTLVRTWGEISREF